MIVPRSSALPETLREAIAGAPEGPGVTAVVAVEGGLFDGRPADALTRHRITSAAASVAEAARGLVDPSFRAADWSGEHPEDLDELGRTLFREETGALMFPEVWEALAEHRRRGHRIVLVTEGPAAAIATAAEALEADAVLAPELGRRRGDGALDGTIGPSPWDNLDTELAGLGVDKGASFGYASEPVHVGTAVVVATRPDRTDELVLPVAPRDGWSRPDAYLRTAAFYGGLLGGFAVGAGVGLLHRSKRKLLDVAGTVGAEVGLGLAGVDVDVTGTEHLWSARPCVFVFNHQSGLDVPLLMTLLRGGFTGVAKEEAASMPLWGQMFKLADVAFVRRGQGSTRRAEEALEPAVNRLRDDGISLVIAPEGTRSATPALGRFKKGAFHIALRAGVPMVPIVFRNTGELMWRHQQTLRGGTVEVRVLPPVDTSGWSADTLDAHVAEVRTMFVDALADRT